MATKKTKVKTIPRKQSKLKDIKDARVRVAGAGLEFAAAKTRAKEAKESYEAAIGGLLRIIDNDDSLPLFDGEATGGKKEAAKKKPKRRGGLE